LYRGFLEEVDIDDFGYVTLFQISVDYISILRKAVFQLHLNLKICIPMLFFDMYLYTNMILADLSTLSQSSQFRYNFDSLLLNIHYKSGKV